MGITAVLDYFGLYSWNPKLFDDMKVPEQVDKAALVNRIIMDSLELEVLYNDPEYVQYRIGVWSKTRIGVWNELAKTMEYEYDPISNYDRKEEWTDNETRNLADNKNVTQHDDASSFSNQSEKSESTDSVAGFNNSGFVDKQKNEYNGSGNASANGEINSTIAEHGTDTGTIDRTHTLRAYGNIGVTTTQQMIEAQRQAVLFNLYDTIKNEFIEEFCIRVY